MTPEKELAKSSKIITSIDDIDEYLNEHIDYSFIDYVPTEEAVMMVNFIKEVNGGSEENETPMIHMEMMRAIFNQDRRTALLIFRGAAKTTLLEYLTLFTAAFSYIPGFGKVDLGLYPTLQTRSLLFWIGGWTYKKLFPSLMPSTVLVRMRSKRQPG